MSSPWMSNWNGAVEGARLSALLASGLWKDRYAEVDRSINYLYNHIDSFGSYGWSQEGPYYQSLSLEWAYLAANAVSKQLGETELTSLINSKQSHLLYMLSTAYNEKQNSLNWGVASGYFKNSGIMSTMMGMLPDSELPIYKWFYDHHRGI